jgi:MraZ protein
VFSGESSHTLDAKHRVFVPKRFQEALERDDKGHLNAILTRGFENCLFLFSEQGFARVLERLQTQPFGGAQLRKMQRLFFAHTHRSQLDASGRLVLPEKLRNLAGIEREVVLVGVADRAEIWDRARWERFESENADDFDELDVVLVGPWGNAATGGE